VRQDSDVRYSLSFSIYVRYEISQLFPTRHDLATFREGPDGIFKVVPSPTLIAEAVCTLAGSKKIFKVASLIAELTPSTLNRSGERLSFFSQQYCQ
jgi:hypothetical protein